MKFNETQYYYQGYSSHQTGVPYESSPHVIGSPARLEWCRGWRDAETDYHKRSESNQNDNTNQKFESLASNPVEAWKEGGLPPVGTECEWLASGDHDWIGVKVLAYHEDEVWLQPLNGAQSFTVGNPDDFRPIRSKEERKREEIISDLMNALGHAHGLFDLNQIYNALSSGMIRHVKVEVSDE